MEVTALITWLLKCRMHKVLRIKALETSYSGLLKMLKFVKMHNFVKRNLKSVKYFGFDGFFLYI